jgi:hypothetical protein
MKAKEEVLDKMLIAFENGQSASQFSQTYFLDRTKKALAPIKNSIADKTKKK